ncbi:Glucans biosynthesis protein C [Serratia fonticola]|uniref:Glucans biosynthesis protein C n=1 Tax=Serratia fonticola TaxID=47917 RepID=A0A4U9VMY6_SERFO|nr:Glucans biosynthesis protein C [Serratia fonticola]
MGGKQHDPVVFANGAETTLFTPFACKVFFIISGYFSYMLYERYDSHRWLKVRLERVAIPLLSSIPFDYPATVFFTQELHR